MKADSAKDIQLIRRLAVEVQQQADRIEWLESDVAGWRIKNQQLRDVLTWISDPSYVGSYSDIAIVEIYRRWAKRVLDGTPTQEGRGGTAEAVSHNAEEIRTAKAAPTSPSAALDGTPSEEDDANNHEWTS